MENNIAARDCDHRAAHLERSYRFDILRRIDHAERTRSEIFP